MFDELDTSQKISYLKGCLPTRPYNRVTSGYGENSDEALQQLLSEGKRVLASRMQTGRNYWDFLIEERDVLSDKFREESSYRELAYYLAALGDSGLETYPLPFNIVEGSELHEIIRGDNYSADDLEEFILSDSNQSVEKGFSSVGSDIWSSLGEEPSLRLGHFEDKNHLFLEYWVKTKDQIEYHERRGEFIEFPVLRKLSCRIHLDDEFVEVRGRNERKKDREAIPTLIASMFGNSLTFGSTGDIATDGGMAVEITDDTIRHFYTLPEFETLSHASKDGTARSSWTADDVRDDSRYPDDRPNNYNNLVFNLDDVERVSFQLNAEENTFRIFKQLILPEDHISVAEYIMENIENGPS